MERAVKSEPVSSIKVSELFEKNASGCYVLPASSGVGWMKILRIEDGLTTAVWNLMMNKNSVVETDVGESDKQFCIAFFPDSAQFILCNGCGLLDKNVSWDMFFVRSPNLCFRLNRDTTYRCITIHFSENWLKSNISTSEQFLTTLEMLSVDVMNSAERQLINQLLENDLTSIATRMAAKASILGVICDCLMGMEGNVVVRSIEKNDLVAEVSKFLSKNIALIMPDLNYLAKKFCVSPSTLNRRFKEHYGECISEYFLKKKMALARILIEERRLTVREAAFILGYKSRRNFIKAYGKFGYVSL